MEIDLDQLPIPDWGLLCPGCRYPLVGLPERRCPECGCSFEMQELVKSWTRLRDPWYAGDELPIPDFGLACSACGHALAGCVTHDCPGCGSRVDPRSYRPQRNWFVVTHELAAPVPLAVVEPLFSAENIPFFREPGRPLRDILTGPRAVGVPLRVPSEFYFDVLWLLRDAAKEMEKVACEPDGATWTCRHCGESSPQHFEVCWNCERQRGES